MTYDPEEPAGTDEEWESGELLGEDLALPAELDLPPDHRSGFVAVVGKPNVGKSTLMNAYLGQKIAIVSPKPQTTRNRLLGILTLERQRGDVADAQVIFVDTPGIHRPLHKLGQYMVDQAVRAIPDADLVLFVVDVSQPPNEEDLAIGEILRRQREMPVLLVLNKVDLVGEGQAGHAAEYQALGEFRDSIPISALQGKNRDRLLEMILKQLPVGPRYYPEEQITDQQLRFMAAELVREAVMMNLRQEIPYSVAVIVDQFKERSQDLTYISATVLVERETQKAIILGHGGEMIKRIGRDARRQIEELLGTRVFLELWVKVRKRWRADEQELRRLGYATPGRGE
ncbi:MAG: GTPase Era [Chloroflexi bacterium]|nr:MAG: GTPase Era [Chloroflexota bacterium]